MEGRAPRVDLVLSSAAFSCGMFQTRREGELPHVSSAAARARLPARCPARSCGKRALKAAVLLVRPLCGHVLFSL